MTTLTRWANRAGLPPAMLAFWLAIMAMTLASIAYTGVATYVLHLKFPYGPPLFFNDDRWFDFTIYHDRFQHVRTPSFWDAYQYPFTYPAALAVVYAGLYTVPHALRYYLIAYAGIAVALWMMLRRALVQRGVANSAAILFAATLFATNYPLRTLYESANTEGITALLAAAGVWLIVRDRSWPGAALLALAGSMKIFPLILLALLLSRRRYREFFAALALAALITVVSLAWIGPSVAQAQQHIDEGIRYVKDVFILSTHPATVTFNHSLFGIVKFAVAGVSRLLHPMPIHNHADLVLRDAHERGLLETTFNIYTIAAAAFGFFTYFVWLRRLPLLNQVLGLTAMAVLLPPLSADYTLIHLLLPFTLLCFYAVDLWSHGAHVRGLIKAFLCFAVIFAYQTYWTLRYRFSNDIRTLGLIALLIVALRCRFPWVWLDGESTRADGSPTPAPSPALAPA